MVSVINDEYQKIVDIYNKIKQESEDMPELTEMKLDDILKKSKKLVKENKTEEKKEEKKEIKPEQTKEGKEVKQAIEGKKPKGKEPQWYDAMDLLGSLVSQYSAISTKMGKQKKGTMKEQIYIILSSVLQEKGYLKVKGPATETSDLLSGLETISLDNKLNKEEQLHLLMEQGKKFIEGIDKVTEGKTYKKAMSEARQYLNSNNGKEVIINYAKAKGLDTKSLTPEECYIAVKMSFETGMSPELIKAYKDDETVKTLMKLAYNVKYEQPKTPNPATTAIKKMSGGVKA